MRSQTAVRPPPGPSQGSPRPPPHACPSLQCQAPKGRRRQGDLATLGFRVADSGPHTSKTLMLQELEALLAAIPADAPAKAYRAAIVEENVLGKRTLYAFKETASRPLFRMVRRLWDVDPVQPYQRQVCLRPIAKRRDET